MPEAAATEEWVVEYERGLDYVEHRGGVPWHKAPVPRRLFHRHSAQTRGFINGHYVERCACGAYGPKPFVHLGHWREARAA